VLALLAVAVGAIMNQDANSAFQSPIDTPEAWTQETPVIGTPALPSCDGGEAPCYGRLPTPTSMELVKPAVPTVRVRQQDDDDDDEDRPAITQPATPEPTPNPLEGIKSLPVTGS